MPLRAAVAVCALLVLAAGCGDSRSNVPRAAVEASRTPPPPFGLPGRERAVVWAVGDGGTGDEHARDVAALIRRDRPDRVLYLGDVYERGRAPEFERNFAAVYGASLLRRMAPTPGNHEWARRREGYDPFWQRIRGRRLPYRYAFTVAGWRIISLNSQSGIGGQAAWLRRELARGRGTCRIAFWHLPRLSAGRHGDNREVEPFWRALRGRASLVLSGHDHDQQRFRPVDGLTQIVSGAGGRHLYEVDEADPRLAWSDDRRRGALRMVLRPGRADLRFVDAGGRVLDSSTVHCRK